MLSHDDSQTETRDFYRAKGARIAEFPMHDRVFLSAREAGDWIVLGAPNAMRGGSHLGSPGAADMIARGLCDILASDYFYPAMLGAIVRLQADGALRYLNPQAEALFGLDGQAVWDRHLLDLLPDLDPLLLNSPHLASDLGPELVRLETQGRTRLFAVTRSDISEGAHHGGYVWVLRDVTDEQQAMRVLQETRRRYQDIFEGTGVALCVLDLSELRSFLLQQRVRDSAGLQRWLQADPEHHEQLRQQLHAMPHRGDLHTRQRLQQRWQALHLTGFDLGAVDHHNGCQYRADGLFHPIGGDHQGRIDGDGGLGKGRRWQQGSRQ